ncbi:penicillin acylase family protein [Thalassomonas sp. M1454]|uniref:penicillin acylase family protein n=1 Tax=Thalassomonas sp. M1454 TaxID=2594477 RepID=UPI00117D5E48|nr:penicillin acylase family protein [Thalassomonas sp. M1454]TRX54963.1 acylase [Thalassomonas sp. M1454]
MFKYIQVIVTSLMLTLLFACSESENTEVQRWQQQAQSIKIIRDEWGIPHVYGETDADAVFGMVYAQAEDDFNRIEINYLNAMGRLAEAEGESAIYQDLRMKLFIDPESLKQQFLQSPEPMQKLMVAFADGLNYYLYKNPQVTPKVIKRFEPWMALSFTEGSIGGDIERVNLTDLENFYQGKKQQNLAMLEPYPHAEPTGSNGFAIAPTNSATGNALLLINPHTSFYFRAEMHMVSEEGLNAYGAVTWGQFFIYQGFNSKTGWMHTSSGADAIDWYEESIVKKADGLYYQYGDELKPVTAKIISVPYKTADGIKNKEITAYFTHHGPIVAGTDNKWLSIKLMNEPVKALQQSYLRTKTTDYESYKQTMRFHTNSSNNTVYADNSGNIAYFHGNFIPKRDTSFNWNKPVDGSNPATEWQGLHTIEETVGVLNPATGWLQNTNNWPYSVIGETSPKQDDFPSYMATFPENYRGINAIKVLKNKKDFTIDSLIAAAYDPYLAAFDALLPILFSQYESADEVTKLAFAPQIYMLKDWDKNSGVNSIATSVAIFWGRELREQAIADKVGLASYKERNISFDQYMLEVAQKHALTSLKVAINKLTKDFGKWDTPWGEINRFQRLTGDIVQPFDDTKPSLAVGFASSRWGSLAAYGQRTFNGTKKFYGTRGNSFVAVVEFGDKVKAKAITAGGQSGDPQSPHFNDQAELYAKGQLRPVHYYKEDVEKAATRSYSPGQK